jgi:hypothetical protein
MQNVSRGADGSRRFVAACNVTLSTNVKLAAYALTGTLPMEDGYVSVTAYRTHMNVGKVNNAVLFVKVHSVAHIVLVVEFAQVFSAACGVVTPARQFTWPKTADALCVIATGSGIAVSKSDEPLRVTEFSLAVLGRWDGTRRRCMAA